MSISLNITINSFLDSFTNTSNCLNSNLYLNLCNLRSAWETCLLTSNLCLINIPNNSNIILNSTYGELNLLSDSNIIIYGNNSTIQGTATYLKESYNYNDWIIASNLMSTYSGYTNYQSKCITGCPGDSLEFSGCDHSSGDTFYHLYADGVEIRSNDDNCGLVSKINYNIPVSDICKEYCLNVGCYGDTSCSTNVTLTHIAVVEYTPQRFIQLGSLYQSMHDDYYYYGDDNLPADLHNDDRFDDDQHNNHDDYTFLLDDYQPDDDNNNNNNNNNINIYDDDDDDKSNHNDDNPAGSASITLELYDLTLTGFGADIGGVLSLEGTMNIHFKSINFINNFALLQGGAINFHQDYYYAKTFYHIIENCTFIDNKATVGGSLYYLYPVKINFKNSIIKDSNAQFGGGIFITGGILYQINNVDFINCHAKTGGGLFLSNVNSYSTIHSTNFKSCTSSDGGSAIYMYQGNNMIFNDISCISSSTNGSGGCLWFKEGEDITLQNSLFLQSSALNGGCAYFNHIEGFIMKNNQFQLCEALQGGAITFFTMFNGVLRDTYITHSMALKGGGIYFEKSGDMNIKQLYISTCSGYLGGGIFINFDKHIRISFSKVINSIASTFGGGIYVQNSFAPHLTVEVINCTAGDSGGGISFQVNNTTPVLLKSNIKNNYATNSGGGIYFRSKNYNSVIVYSNITNNVADNGGGISYYSSNPSSLITNYPSYKARKVMETIHPMPIGSTEFDEIFTKGDGFIITFDEKTALGDGDVLTIYCEYYLNGSWGDIYQFYVYDSSSDFPGINIPPLRVYGNSLFIQLDTSILHKTALYGYKIYITPIYPQHDKKTIIKDNIALSLGGGISYGYGNLAPFILTTNIINNTAIKGAGGIYLNANNNGCIISYCNIKNNYVKSGNGGGLLISALNSALHTDNSLYILNQATFGGAIYSAYQNGVGGYSSKNELIIHNTILLYNKADNGGALYFEFNNIVSLINVTSLNNTALNGHGGAIMVESQNIIEIIESKFQNNHASIRGGVIHSFEQNIITISVSDFISNTANSIGGAISIQNFTKIIFNGEINIINNKAKYGGGGIVSIRCPLWHIDSTYYDYFNSVTYDIITYINIKKNTANWGSAMLFQAFQHESNIELNNITISNNHANVGGTIYWIKDNEMNHEVSGIKSKTVKILNNFAYYGNIIATQPIQMNSPKYYYVTKFSTVIDPPIQLIWMDYYNQIIKSPITTTSVTVEILEDSKNKVYCNKLQSALEGLDLANNAVKFNFNGTATFNSLIPYCAPSGNLTIQFTAELGDLILPSQISSKYYIKNQSILLFRSCERGEYISNGQCVKCQKGSFSFHFSQEEQCNDCTKMDGVVTCFNDQIILETGYWRRQPDSTAIFQCPMEASSCKGGNETGKKLCSDGYSGPLCSVCAPGYFQSETLCLACEGESVFTPILLIYILLAVIFIGVGLSVVFFRKKILEKLEQRHQQLEQFVRKKGNKKLELSSITRVPGPPQPKLNQDIIKKHLEKRKTEDENGHNDNDDIEKQSDDTISDSDMKARLIPNKIEFIFFWVKANWERIVIKSKIIVATFQVVVGIGDVVSVDFPPIFTSFTGIFSFFHLNLWNAVPLACSVHITFIDKLILVTLAPIALTSVFWMLFVIEYLYHNSKKNQSGHDMKKVYNDLKDKYTNLLFYLSYLILPSVTSTIFETFLCENIDPYNEDVSKDDYYLIVDRNISCSSSYYYNGVLYAILMIIVYPIGIPAIYFYVLYTNRQEIMTRYDLEGNERDFFRDYRKLSSQASRISFLYEEYEPQYWYWELVETARRLMLTAVLSVVAHGTSEQTVICVLVSIAFVKLYAFFAPYMDLSDDILAEVGQYQILFTFFGALIMQGELVRSQYNHVIGIALVVVNVGVIFVPLWLGYVEYKENKEKEKEEEEEKEHELEKELEGDDNNNNNSGNINSTKSKEDIHISHNPPKNNHQVNKQKSIESLHMQRVKNRMAEYERQHSNTKPNHGSPVGSPRKSNSATSSPSKPVIVLTSSPSENFNLKSKTDSINNSNLNVNNNNNNNNKDNNNNNNNNNDNNNSNSRKTIEVPPPPSNSPSSSSLSTITNSNRHFDRVQTMTPEQPQHKIILKPLPLPSGTNKVLPSPRFEDFDEGEWDDYKPLSVDKK